MQAFVRDVRTRIDAATQVAQASWAERGGNIDGLPAPPAEVALGVRLTPAWAVLRAQQGLDDPAALVTPVAAGGQGVTYVNWGVFFWAYQPFDSVSQCAHH